MGDSPSCSCAERYIGSPPNCRPECVVNTDCSSIQSCINEKCRDPCLGACGNNAQCNVINHTPICTCLSSYVGDPFTNCHPKPPETRKLVFLEENFNVNMFITFPATKPPKTDPCNICGTNTNCNNGICTCIAEYHGNPHQGCRPECVLNNDCVHTKACIRQKCSDPCPGTCGQNSLCSVINHIPMCSCPNSFTGNAFISCTEIKSM